MNSFTSSIKNIFFYQAFVGINLQESQCRINVDIKKGKILKKNIKKIFYISNYKISEEIITFIHSIINKYNYTYIMSVNYSTKQGAVLGCDRSSFKKFNIDHLQVTSLCVDDSWQSYIYTKELHEFENMFDQFDLDYITSPFIIQSYILNKSKESGTKLLVLNQKDVISVGIFKDNTIIFSSIESILFINQEEDEEEIIEIIDEDEIPDDNHDDFAEFEDEIDENIIDSDDNIDIDEELNKELEEVETQDSDIEIDDEQNDSTKQSQFEIDKQKATMHDTQNSIKILNIIKSSIDDFYKSDLYNSDFIEKIIILTDEKLSEHTKEYIEDEILLDIELLNIDTSEIMSKLAYEESINEL